MKVVVTGGSGKVGQLVIKGLLDHGHAVLSIDRVPPQAKLCRHLTVDLKDIGQVYQALEGSEAVIHLAAYAAPNLVPDSETFCNNVTLTYNVLNSAHRNGIRRVAIASSGATFGFAYSKKDPNPDYLPLDEQHGCRPQDPYGLSKLVGEKIADSFAALGDMTICTLRFPRIVFSYEDFPKLQSTPERWRNRLWTYIDVRDVVNAFETVLEAKIQDHEVFLFSAPGSEHNGPTYELLEKYLPNVRNVRTGLQGNWSCIDASKAEKLLGFKSSHSWEQSLK